MDSHDPMNISDAAPDVLRRYTAAEHRRRLLNIAFCRARIRGCMRVHAVTNYLPGQAYYNLCEYPCRAWTPEAQDEEELDRLRDHGIRLIQLHSDWSDHARRFGGHTFAPADADGLRRFVAMAHQRGIRVLLYVSTGYFERRDPDFREEWARSNDTLTATWYRLARCSPASASWRAYLLPHLVRLMDEYGVDGLYNDAGYHPLHKRTWAGPPTADEVLAFEEGPGHDGAFMDLLAMIYDEVHRRGGLVKVHARNVHFGSERHYYDYLWVGETATNADVLREQTKNVPPYVVPCLDLRTATVEQEEHLYVQAVPYMQFPVLLAGRPYTGERIACPGVEYAKRDDGEELPSTRADRSKWEYFRAHPDGPWTYGSWDSCPPVAERRAVHARQLRAYLPLVEPGTQAWLEVSDSDLFATPLPAGVVASIFANRATHLVVANYGSAPAAIATRDAWFRSDAPAAATHWTLPARTMYTLRRDAASVGDAAGSSGRHA